MSIYIPKTINVGYQNRSGTYTGKLAYVIYYDEKGKLRKEASWNSWRDDSIPNTEFDNTPTEGFVLNKKAGDYSSGWDHRKAYCRVYDPRGFEFEITIENLLYILENATSTKGKGLEGEFVYGWDGKDLILMPVESPDYKSIIEYSNIVNKNEYVKAKDLKIGATYLDKNNKKYVYMGRYDRWTYCYKKNGKIFNSEYDMEEYCKKNDIQPDKVIKSTSWYLMDREIWNPDEEGQMIYEKCHVFYYKEKDYNGKYKDSFDWNKSISRKFISCINEECIENYAELYDKLEHTSSYSPIDDTKDEYVNCTLDEFKKYLNENPWRNHDVFVDEEEVSITKQDDSYILVSNKDAEKFGFKVEKDKKYPNSEARDMIGVSIEEMFNKLKPCYKKVYLVNGKLHHMEGICNE